MSTPREQARQFPILGRPEIHLPWSLFAPHEAQARSNHGQTLQRLSERGGLDPQEALAVLFDLHYDNLEMGDMEAVKTLRLLALVAVPDAPRPAGKDESRLGRLEAALKEIRGTLLPFDNRYQISVIDAAIASPADPQETKG